MNAKPLGLIRILLIVSACTTCNLSIAQEGLINNGGQINLNGGPNINLGGTLNISSGGIGGLISIGGNTLGSSGSLNLSGGNITLNNGGIVSNHINNITLGTGSVTVAGESLASQGGTITLQNQGAMLNWNDSRIAPTNISNFYGGSGVPVAASITTLPANTQYGILVAGDGTIALYRAGSGAVQPSHAVDSVGTAALSGNTAMSAIGTVPNGAHSRPLQYRTVEGKRLAWVAGDLGTDEHGSRDGNLALGEVGLGYNLGPMQINLSLGRTHTHQNTSLNGYTEAQGNYLLLEGLIPLATPTGESRLWLTLSGYGNFGDARVRRGYLNMGAPDASNGSADTRVYGLRARLDWENALAIDKWSMSPYIDLTHNSSKMEAYAERGGGFPARFDARRDNSDDLRLGIHWAYPLPSDSRFVALTEFAHRFQDKTGSTSGEVVGMFAFSVPGQSIRQDWLRLGTGIEGKIGEGTGSLMLNLTTQGSAPNAWLALSYQVGF